MLFSGLSLQYLVCALHLQHLSTQMCHFRGHRDRWPPSRQHRWAQHPGPHLPARKGTQAERGAAATGARGAGSPVGIAYLMQVTWDPTPDSLLPLQFGSQRKVPMPFVPQAKVIIKWFKTFCRTLNVFNMSAVNFNGIP